MKYLFECDQPNCYRRLTFNSENEVLREKLTHKCPYWGGESKVSWSVTKTLVQQMWDMLDAELDQLKGHWASDGSTKGWVSGTPVNPEYHQHRARAISDCLAIFMQPFFTTADDIAREAIRRWEARRDTDLEYETPGIGARRYETAAMAHSSAADGWYSTPEDGYTSDPQRAGAVSDRRGRRSTAVGAPAAPPAIKLSEADQKAIRNAHEQMPQIFTAEVLAKQYGLSVAVIKAVLGA
jgi:hypothetical protein